MRDGFPAAGLLFLACASFTAKNHCRVCPWHAYSALPAAGGADRLWHVVARCRIYRAGRLFHLRLCIRRVLCNLGVHQAKVMTSNNCLFRDWRICDKGDSIRDSRGCAAATASMARSKLEQIIVIMLCSTHCARMQPGRRPHYHTHQ